MSTRAGERNRRRARRTASPAAGRGVVVTRASMASGRVQHLADLLQKGAGMRRTDIEAVGELAGEALHAGGGLVKEMHEGIAERAFGASGAGAAPARAIHDTVARGVYAGVRTALRAGARGGAGIVAHSRREEGAPLASTPAGSFVLGALNGFYGDKLTDRRHGLALDMAFRRDGEDVELTADGLDAAFPDATSRIVVFVHGLCGDDE